MTRCRRRSHWNLVLGSWLAIGSAIATSLHCAVAQITSDRTLPNNSRVTTQNNTRIIEGGTKAGSNLFHSFEQFWVPTGSTAYFNNALDIQNIISRVTGKSVSNIDGLIKANGTANLFLINPQGIIFGHNARLDIGGSFLATTASSLKFADGSQFSATSPQTTPLLTVSVPVGLQLGGNPGSILNQSQATDSNGETVGLQVQPGKTLALVGGDISFDGGNLQAKDGRVELAGVTGSGTVLLNVNGNNLSLSVPQLVDTSDVSFTNSAEVDVTDKGAGSVRITARNLEIMEGSKIRAGIGQGLTATSSPRGDITLNATGKVTINHPSRVTNVVAQNATGDAGNINIRAGEIAIDNRASAPTDSLIPAALETSPLGLGRAGNISLETTGSIALIGQDVNPDPRVIRTSSSYGIPGGGDITLKANGSISLSNAYLKSPRGNGGGNISLIGNDSVSIANNSSLIAGSTHGNSGLITIQSLGPVSIQRSLVANTVGGDPAGNAGDINISGRSVSITEGTRVEASSEKGGANSGNIRIFATDKVEISGTDPFHNSQGDVLRQAASRLRTNSAENTTLTTRTQEGATGKAGNITIQAGEIFIKNQASNPPDIGLTPALEAASDGEGPAGNVSLKATGSITLIGQDVNPEDRLIRTSNPNGRPGGGDITLQANGSISLSNAYLKAPGGGNISLVGNDSVTIADNSYLNAGATRGDSGSIAIQSLGSVSIQRSRLGTNVGMGELAGNVGDINITGRSVSITEGAQLEASSEINGVNSGKIQINATDKVEISGLDRLQGSQGDRTPDYEYTTLTTRGQFGSRGQAGDISVNTRQVRVSDGANLIANSENAFTGGNINVNANVVELTNGGKFLTNASNNGDAGNINLKLSDRLVIDGSNSKFNTQGIFANTISSKGGNIAIDVGNLLLLRNHGQIFAVAAENGNGGNIKINAPSGFIVAVPTTGNNDITADAKAGFGGTVTINATGIFGMVVRTREDLLRLLGSNLDPQLLPTNDISAISQTSPTLNGSVTINTPDIDLSRGLVNLPAVTVDTNVAQGCTAGGAQAQSEFIITGRGGLPPNPGEALSTDAVQVDLVTLNPEVAQPSTSAVSTSRTTSAPPPIVEATGWVVDADGSVVLTANAPTVTPHSSRQTPTKCSALKSSS